jgi:hypothetical protein
MKTVEEILAKLHPEPRKVLVGILFISVTTQVPIQPTLTTETLHFTTSTTHFDQRRLLRPSIAKT